MRSKSDIPIGYVTAIPTFYMTILNRKHVTQSMAIIALRLVTHVQTATTTAPSRPADRLLIVIALTSSPRITGFRHLHFKA